MANKKNTPNEVVEETVNEAAKEFTEQNAEQTPNEVVEETANEEAKEATERHEEPEPPCARVYCGPTIPGVAHRFTVYSGGNLPEALQGYIEAHPAARGMICDIDELAEMRMKVEQPGTAENTLYKQIKNNL